MESKLILQAFTPILFTSYKLIKGDHHFSQFHGILSRIDLSYDRQNQSTDQINSQEFINSSFLEFQDSHSRKNLQLEKNQKSLVLKIGSRKSQKYYRLYTKNNFLKFEFEIKGNFIKNLQQLLVEQRFELFHSSIEPSHLDWVMNQVRVYQ